MINVGTVVTSASFSKSFTIKRRDAGSFASEGVFTRGAETLIPAVGSIQPAKMADITAMLPEGERTRETVVIYSTTLLRKGDGQEQPDYVVHLGKNWRVIETRQWQEFGYYQAWAVAENV